MRTLRVSERRRFAYDFRTLEREHLEMCVGGKEGEQWQSEHW